MRENKECTTEICTIYHVNIGDTVVLVHVQYFCTSNRENKTAARQTQLALTSRVPAI